MSKRPHKEGEKALVTFQPAEHFFGYPFGKVVEFKVGVESIPVPAEFVQLMREKGHVALSTTVTEQD